MNVSDIDFEDSPSQLIYTWTADANIAFIKDDVSITSFSQADVNSGAITIISYAPPINRGIQFTVTDTSGANVTQSTFIHDSAMLTTGISSWTQPSLNYIFFNSIPNYYASDASERNGFMAFTEAQKTVARDLLSYISKFTNLTFNEVTDVAQSQLGFASTNQNIYDAYTYHPDNTMNSLGGDMWFNLNFPLRS